MSKNIILIGPMGAGKSTIGLLLADVIGCEFRDSDKEVEDKAGANIPWIFDVEGESGFREREFQAIEYLTSEKNIVIATGGGAVIRKENRDLLSKYGCIVYLKTSVEQQLLRTHKDANRPLLQQDDPKKVLTQLLKQREPLYIELADLIVDTNANTPKQIVEKITEFKQTYDLSNPEC
ncbi:shikimate kinase AroK [Marinicellulosiphila megalodicopiae]|uniref:shikimate kinase AroK n=1 Tax=Marinicellulosiphila megalodicopiae TaxID=2724896 RepID=UPI003BB213C4